MLCCTGYQYVSSPVYVPLNESKNEVSANLSTNSFRLGYSVSDHISLFTAYYQKSKVSGFPEKFLNNGDESVFDAKYMEWYDGNLGFSYFNKYKYFNYEILTGAGYGKSYYRNEIVLRPDRLDFKMNSERWNCFLQGNVGYKVSNIFQFALFSKLTYTNYFNLNTSLLTTNFNEEMPAGVNFFNNQTETPLFFTDVGLCARVGYKYLFFQTMYFETYNIKNHLIHYRKHNFQISIFFTMNLSDQ
jgi:hypothetical protein